MFGRAEAARGMQASGKRVTGAAADVDRFCTACRTTVLAEIRHILDKHRWGHDELDALVLDYPLRPAKALRPSLCIATARALGASEDAVITSASVVELLHNAFLIHDDVEDESLFRRGEPTLQRSHGLPVAVNVADGMFAVSLIALLDNLETIGLRASLAVFRSIVDTLWTTVGGQGIELTWIRENRWEFPNYREAYEDLVYRKTSAYSFVAPVEIATIVASSSDALRAQLRRFARHVGIAFQIADDLLNLDESESGYGKEPLGDLWEGKRTLILLHALASESNRTLVREAIEILAKARPAPEDARTGIDDLAAVIDDLHASGHVDTTGRTAVLAALRRVRRSRSGREIKTDGEVRALADLVTRTNSIAFARDVANEHVRIAKLELASCTGDLAAGDARDFLFALPTYVLERLR